MPSSMPLFPRKEEHHNPYGYVPTLYVCIIFICLFATSTLIHLAQAAWKRTWFLLPTIVLCGVGEVIGWSGRLWSSKNVYSHDAHLTQISTTIISPTFLAAANFIIFGIIIQRAGAQFSYIPAKKYAWIFVSVDVVALVVQAIGGAMASISEQTDKGTPETGGHVMLAGIVIQLVEIVIYVAFAANFFYNYSHDKAVRLEEERGGDTTLKEEDREMTAGVTLSARVPMPLGTKLMIVGLVLSTTCLFVRSVYRTIELSNGWTGRIIHTQVYFNVLDGAMIVFAMFTTNLLHPGYLL